ncbi:sensor histidine kinase, partial [Enterobacter sichuanensis]|uniref:sensor histidine kinase n=1 Tax=Enterobacter sichuanensis TaxID=2071710 RepID=UPI0021D37932
YEGVTAEEQEDWLVLSVFDNGRGIVEPQIQQILDGNGSRADGKKHGHGIYNVNERLRIRYGEESRLRFSNRKNGGTQVTIRISKEKLIHKEGDCYHV